MMQPMKLHLEQPKTVVVFKKGYFIQSECLYLILAKLSSQLKIHLAYCHSMDHQTVQSKLCWSFSASGNSPFSNFIDLENDGW